MFNYLIAIEPLGLLYGSAGRFLSPDNLIGRAGSSFPPSAATLSGIFVSTHGKEVMQAIHLAGPFWAKTDFLADPQKQDFYVPTPKSYLAKNGKIQHQLAWNHENNAWLDVNGALISGKFDSQTWLSLREWQSPQHIEAKPPWKPLTHLHPKLKPDERHVIDVTASDPDKPGSLFAEYAIQMEPETCLVYLATHKLDPGWYRFGGEGHIVEITSHEISPDLRAILTQPLGDCFALIAPAIWGSKDYSYRAPYQDRGQLYWDKAKTNPVKALLTERPHPFRYRLGRVDNAAPHEAKRLSRGRYAVPAGSVYLLEQAQPTWQKMVELSPEMFPNEGLSYVRWGCGLALPLPHPPDPSSSAPETLAALPVQSL